MRSNSTTMRHLLYAASIALAWIAIVLIAIQFLVFQEVSLIENSSRSNTNAAQVLSGTDIAHTDMSVSAGWATDAEAIRDANEGRIARIEALTGAKVSLEAKQNRNTAGTYRWYNQISLTDTATADYLHSLETELSRYSKQYFQAIDLQAIYLIDGIHATNGAPIIGFADMSRREIYFDAADARTGSPFMRSVIHHELAHIAVGNTVAGQQLLAEWTDTYDNAALFTNTAAQEKYSSGASFDATSFVNAYAATSTHEDIAETIAYAMTPELQSGSMQMQSAVQDKLDTAVQYLSQYTDK